MPAAPLTGPGYLLKGFKLLKQPGIRLYAALPVLIGTLVFGLLIWLASHYFGALLQWMLPSGESWWVKLLRGVLWPLFVVSVVLVLYFGFTAVANLLAAPFNGFLAEKVERVLSGQDPSGGSGWGALIADIVPAMLNELRKLLHYLLWAVPLLILFVIPVVNLAAPFLWGLFVAWMLNLEYLEYPMENHNIRFKEVRRRARKRSVTGLAFGGSVMLAMAIPFVNLLAMPAAVAGATAMWVDLMKENAEV